MDAVLIPAGMFACFFIVGYGPLAVLAHDQPPILRILLAPAIGLALLTIVTFWIHRWGYPVQAFAALTATALALASVAAALATNVKKPRAGRDDLLAGAWIIAAALGGMALVAWPGIVRGLNWLGYANEDMANYVLSAIRLRTHGYHDAPSLDTVLDGSDLSQLMWPFNIATRYGGDLIVAWTASVLHISEASLFMPTMVALNTSLVMAATALLVAERPLASTAVIVLLALVINPLVAFSVYMQLLAQVGGLCFAAAFLALLVAPWRLDTYGTIRTAVLAGIVLLALFVWYPEVMVLTLGALGLYFLLNARESLFAWKRMVPAAIALLVAVSLLSGDYLQIGMRYVYYQAMRGLKVFPADTLTFPYFLVRSGLSSFWGLSPITDFGVTNSAIYLGAMLFILAVLMLARHLWQRRLSACMTVVLSAVGLNMFWRNADLALFKTVLYLQPFLIAALAAQLADLMATVRPGYRSSIVRLYRSPIAFFRATRSAYTLRRLRTAMPVIVVCVVAALAGWSQIKTFLFYSNIAADRPGSGLFNEIPGAAREGLLQQLGELKRPAPGGHFVIDSYNSVLVKLIAAYTMGTPTRIVSQNSFKIEDFGVFLARLYPQQAAKVAELKSIEIPFTWATTGQDDRLHLQVHGQDLPQPSDTLIAAAGDNSILNRTHTGYPQSRPLAIQQVGRITNHVAFLSTRKSRPYFDYDAPIEEYREARRHVALWPNEPDYFYPGRTMSGAGRYVFLGIINPSKQPRLMLEVSASLKRDGANVVPPARIAGQSVVPLDAIGRGSARLFSAPLNLMQLGKWSTIGIDMGVDGRQFTSKDAKVVLDPRWLSAYVRDISLISDDAYLHLKAPSAVTNFPAGLADKGLEYSGVYEDGWIGEAAYLRLAGPTEPARFRVDGVMPWNPASGVSRLVVKVNGVERTSTALKQGPFHISFDMEPSADPIRVELATNGAVLLSPYDTRPASIRLSAIGWDFADKPAPAKFQPKSSGDMGDAFGFWSDGWSAQRAEVTLTGGNAGRVTIWGTVPNVARGFATKLMVKVDDHTVGTIDIKPGTIAASLPVPASTKQRRVALEFLDGQDLPAPDGRHVGMLVERIAIE